MSTKTDISLFAKELDGLHESLSLLDDPESIATKMVNRLTRTLNAPFASMFIDDNLNGRSLCIQSGARKKELREEPVLLKNAASQKRLLEKRGIIAKEIGISRAGKINCLISPLVTGGDWSASLTVAKPSEEEFSDEEKRLFKLFTKYSGLVIQNLDFKRQIKYLTEYDPLTDLPHCQTFNDYLINAVRRSSKKNVPMSLMFIDIDNFRAYNDRFSHHEGNRLLKEVSAVLKNNCKHHYEIPCRYGGEEFAVILEGKAREKSYKIAEQISKHIKLLFDEKRSKAEITVSIGLATYPKNGKDESELLLAVDNALYYAKTLGPDNVFHFEDLPEQSTDFKPMIQALSQTLIHQASEEASEEGLSVVEKLRDELERVLHKTKDEVSSELAGREAVFSLAATVDARDIYTRGHSEQVATFAHQVAEVMGLSLEERELIYVAGFLHDIGKIIIPDFILNKAEELLPSDWTPIREHPAAGVRILEPFEGLHKILPIVLHHHERWNGKGYPLGLKKGQIPLGSRIIAVADAFDAITSSRCYRPEKSIDEAILELKKNVGTQFDPEVVESFLNLGFIDITKS